MPRCPRHHPILRLHLLEIRDWEKVRKRSLGRSNPKARKPYYIRDFDRWNDPSAWEMQINKILGPNFPYFASPGNRDIKCWNGEDGYQQYLKNRLNRLNIVWDGDLGVKSSAVQYKDIFIILVSPEEIGFGHASYIREQLAENRSIWRICS